MASTRSVWCAVAPGVIGFVRDGRLVQVVLLDGAMPVEPARVLVEREAAPAELAGLVATR